MIRRLGLALSILFVVVIGGGIISLAIETPAEQRERELHQELQRKRQLLDQKIKLEPPPEYFPGEDSEASASAAYSCEPGVDRCIGVITEATRAVSLASITKDYLDKNGGLTNGNTKVLRIDFYTSSPADPNGTSYCFDSKDAVFATLGKRKLGGALLLGTIDYSSSDAKHCYIVVYGPHLNLGL
jgi:hypothetical protein